VSCVLLVAHRSWSKCDRSRKYNNPNKLIVIKIKQLCANVFQFVIFVKFDACVTRNRRPLNAEALRDEIVSGLVLVMSVVLVLVAGGTRAVKLTGLYLAGRYAVYKVPSA